MIIIVKTLGNENRSRFIELTDIVEIYKDNYGDTKIILKSDDLWVSESVEDILTAIHNNSEATVVNVSKYNQQVY